MKAPVDAPRYFAFDALRGFMMVLGIVLHTAMFYWSEPPPTAPFRLERDQAYVFDLLLAFIHQFRMPAFFVLSGFLSALLVAQRGFAGFLRNRARRVLLPLVIALVTILPPTAYLFLLVAVEVRFDTRSLLLDRQQLHTLGDEFVAAGFPARAPAVIHLWFLFYLVYFGLLLPVFDWVRRCARRLAPFLGRAVASPLAVVGLGLFCAVTLWPFRGGEVFEGVIQLKPQLRGLIYYGSFFFFGVVVHRHREIFPLLSRRAWWHAAAGLVLCAWAHHASRVEYAAQTATPTVHLAAVLLHGLATWLLVYAAFGLALRFITAESPLLLYLCRSSYWVYLVHPLIIALGVWLLLPYRFHATLKFSGVVIATTAVSFLSYHLLVQGTWIGALLHGRRFDQPWPWRHPPQTTTAGSPCTTPSRNSPHPVPPLPSS